jgi:cytoskeletal protein RodZ
MESIGDKLRGEREQKGFTIEQIARDTNIAKRYLEALEKEDFAVFPGDPYLIGFLRNYAEYLGIDPDEMVSLYKNFTIQSQPVPMDELLDKKRPTKIWLISLIVVVFLGLVAGGYFLYPVIFSPSEPKGDVESTRINASVYELSDRFLERRLYKDDEIMIPVGDEEHTLVVTSITDTLTVEVPGGTNVLRIGDERAVDLNGDATMDIRLALTDIDSAGERPSALVRVERFYREPAGQTLIGTGAEAGESVAAGEDSTPSNVGIPSLTSREVEPLTILHASEPQPFRVTIVFRGYCLFRYAIDDNQREERYFQRGESIELDASRELRVWVSNAGNFIARIGGNEIDFGRPGEVATRMITWADDPRSNDKLLRMVAMY